MLTIGKVAAQAHVSIDTVRYYEKEGLLAPVGRSGNGYRFYDDQAVRRLHFIKHAQHCGLSLWDIRELLALTSRTDSHCQDIRRYAFEKKLQLEQKIRSLQGKRSVKDASLLHLRHTRLRSTCRERRVCSAADRRLYPADSSPMPSTDFEAHLVALARESSWFWPALVAVRSLNLPSWCIGAGAVRNLVWDSLHGLETSSALRDVDVAYFDGADLSAERDATFQSHLSRMHPQLPWEVTNQAAVHTWFEAAFGYAVPPLKSLEAAVASWPEYATAVGLTLLPDDTIKVLAPYELDDLFAMVVRRNPERVSVATYRQWVQEKQYRNRWPRVTIVHC